jgi:hypothetical protein
MITSICKKFGLSLRKLRPSQTEVAEKQRYPNPTVKRSGIKTL